MQGHTAHCPYRSVKVTHTLLPTAVHSHSGPLHTENKFKYRENYILFKVVNLRKKIIKQVNLLKYLGFSIICDPDQNIQTGHQSTKNIMNIKQYIHCAIKT